MGKEEGQREKERNRQKPRDRDWLTSVVIGKEVPVCLLQTDKPDILVMWSEPCSETWEPGQLSEGPGIVCSGIQRQGKSDVSAHIDMGYPPSTLLFFTGPQCGWCMYMKVKMRVRTWPPDDMLIASRNNFTNTSRNNVLSTCGQPIDQLG